MDAHGMPLRTVITEGTRADCKEADKLIDGFKMAHLPPPRLQPILEWARRQLERD